MPQEHFDSVAHIPKFQQLRQIFKAGAAQDQGWEKAWEQDITPWDLGDTQAGLKELLENNKAPYLPTSGKALVPGCGRGHEAVYIGAKLGIDTVGMDIAPTGIQAANENLKRASLPPGANVSFKVDDFFALKFENEADKYDLIFDYTFFVAIPPALRPSWGSQMTYLVKRGGYLVTLMWPMDGDRPNGPPYSINSNDYIEVLQGNSVSKPWTKVYDEPTSTPDRKGTERIAVWKRN